MLKPRDRSGGELIWATPSALPPPPSHFMLATGLRTPYDFIAGVCSNCLLNEYKTVSFFHCFIILGKHIYSMIFRAKHFFSTATVERAMT